MRLARTLGGLCLAALGAGAAEAQRGGAFEPEIFFAGRTRAAGAFVDGEGRPESRFTGETRGRRAADGSTVFDQTIRFQDGAVRRRTWRIVRTGPGTIEATGTDIVGVARGEISGRTLRLLSTIRVSEGNPLTDVEFDQTMTLGADGRTLDNRSIVRKLGFTVRRAEERFVRSGSGRAGR